MTLPAFECYPCGLNNAATSWIMVNHAVIPFFKQLQIFIFIYFVFGSFRVETRFSGWGSVTFNFR